MAGAMNQRLKRPRGTAGVILIEFGEQGTRVAVPPCAISSLSNPNNIADQSITAPFGVRNARSITNQV